MKKLISLLLITAACAVFAGCGGAEKADSPKGFTLQYQEQTLTLQTPPKRVAVLTTPLLNMVYAAGGESVSRPTTRSPIPEAARSLPELGQTQHIDMEKLVALTPDLVLGERSQNRKLESLLQSNHLHYFLINYDGINDNVPLIRFLGRLYGTEEKQMPSLQSTKAGSRRWKKKRPAIRPSVRLSFVRPAKTSPRRQTPPSVRPW